MGRSRTPPAVPAIAPRPPRAPQGRRSRKAALHTPAWLGPPALVNAADAAAYARLERALVAALAPRDAVEWIWVRNVVDLEWQRQSLQQVQATVVALARDEAARAIVADAAPGEALAIDGPPAEGERDVADLWAETLREINATDYRSAEADNHAAFETCEAMLHPPPAPPAAAAASASAGCAAELRLRAIRRLAELGLPPAALDAAAYQLRLPQMEQFARLTAGLEARRDAILRDLEQRRARLRAALPDAADVIDVEVEP